jgi:hypothetical protein
VAAEAYVLAEVDGGMLPNTWNIDQVCKYHAWCIYLINKDTMFLILHLSRRLSSGPSIEGAHQPNSKNDKSQKRDVVFLIWLDSLPQPNIRQFLIGA